MKGAGLVTLLAAGGALAEEPIAVPSGQSVVLQDVVWGEPGPEGLTARFRFVAPAIGADGGVDFETAAADMAFLCENYALPRLPITGPQVVQVIISLAEAPVEFGVAAPEVAQFFEAYSRDGDRCVWEVF